MATPTKVLLVDDDAALREFLDELLTQWGYLVTAADTGVSALELVSARRFDVGLFDLWLPDTDGLQLFRDMHERDPGMAVIMMTGSPTLASAIEALRLGADDYLLKPVSPDTLRHCINRVTEHRFLRREVDSLRSRISGHVGDNEILGSSPAVQRIKAIMEAVAASDSPVLIEGESGTGKELIAAGIHRLSPRRGEPLIPVNCSAIPAELLESELFGHVRGAFSGATADSPGLFRAADGGTIFLDEVTELPLPLQPKLLRALQQGEVRRVGSAKTERVNIRVIAATNRVLSEAVRTGVLRQDLYYRLNVVHIEVPPLRERKRDIPVLATHFIRELGRRSGRELTGIAPDALAALTAYDFPGNVRELQNILERAWVLGARGTITLADLPGLVKDRVPPPPSPTEELPTVAQMERDLILRALALHGQDRERAARAIGLSRRTMFRRLKEYGIP